MEEANKIQIQMTLMVVGGHAATSISESYGSPLLWTFSLDSHRHFLSVLSSPFFASNLVANLLDHSWILNLGFWRVSIPLCRLSNPSYQLSYPHFSIPPVSILLPVAMISTLTLTAAETKLIEPRTPQSPSTSHFPKPVHSNLTSSSAQVP